MGWELDFEARPFKLAIRRASVGPAGRRATGFNPFALPDSLYRVTARRVIGRLAQENRELRHRPYYRQTFFVTALAEAVARWARHRWPD